MPEVVLGSDGEGGVVGVFGEGKSEDSVIRSDKCMVVSFDENRTAGASHAGVHHCDVDRPGRKAGVRLAQCERGLSDVERLNLVGDIDQSGIRADSQDDALHGSDVVVGEAEIGEKGDERRTGHDLAVKWAYVRHSYFDYNATGPVAPVVLRSLAESLSEVYGNASSIHYFGQGARQRVEAARRSVAARLGCDAREIVFTSGGTESDNMALFGVARRAPGCGIVTSAIEHPAVLSTCARLEREGHPVAYLAPGADGVVSADSVAAALRGTGIVSIMHANNETGVMQPIEEIATICRAAEVLLHVDGVQAFGKAGFPAGCDLYSVSGHKMGAPKGVGALYVRKGVALDPILYGGRHERERRAGTENVPGIVALGCAAGIAYDSAGIAALRDRLETGVLARVPACTVNGGQSPRLPNTTNIRFDGIEGEAMTIALDLKGFAVSSGSACSSGAVEPSHVLLAMGLKPEEARSSVRFSLGPGNTVEEVDSLIDAVVECSAHLRRISATFRSEEAVAHA